MRLSKWVALVAVASSASVAEAQQMVTGVVRWQGSIVEDAVVQLLPVEGSSANPAQPPTVINQAHLRFIPEILAIPVGTTVDFLNSDPVMHNVFSPRRRGADFNLGTYARSASRSHTFVEPGAYVILCHVHPEMAAWVVVTESDYFAITGPSGVFSIPDVPAGKYRMTTWAKRIEFPDQVIEVDGPGSRSAGGAR